MSLPLKSRKMLKYIQFVKKKCLVGQNNRQTWLTDSPWQTLSVGSQQDGRATRTQTTFACFCCFSGNVPPGSHPSPYITASCKCGVRMDASGMGGWETAKLGSIPNQSGREMRSVRSFEIEPLWACTEDPQGKPTSCSAQKKKKRKREGKRKRKKSDFQAGDDVHCTQLHSEASVRWQISVILLLPGWAPRMRGNIAMLSVWHTHTHTHTPLTVKYITPVSLLLSTTLR